jgi:hypothetical protein
MTDWSDPALIEVLGCTFVFLKFICNSILLVIYKWLFLNVNMYSLAYSCMSSQYTFICLFRNHIFYRWEFVIHIAFDWKLLKRLLHEAPQWSTLAKCVSLLSF